MDESGTQAELAVAQVDPRVMKIRQAIDAGDATRKGRIDGKAVQLKTDAHEALDSLLRSEYGPTWDQFDALYKRIDNLKIAAAKARNIAEKALEEDNFPFRAPVGLTPVSLPVSASSVEARRAGNQEAGDGHSPSSGGVS